MPIRPFLCVICAVSLTACSPRSEPQAQRGEVASPSTEDPVTESSGTDTKDSEPRADSSSETKTDETGGNQLALDKLTFSIPEGWERKQASSSFVLAEFTLPKAEGSDADGRLTVSVAGGSIEANVDRWRDQFGGKPEPAKEERREIDGIDVALVDFSGDFNDQRGPFAPATPRSGYRMLAAIIPVDGELHFVKATGPQATMATHEERFKQFIESVKKK